MSKLALASDPDALLSPAKAAALLGASIRTLEGWRVRGGGPPYIRISSRMLRYRRGDLIQFIESRRLKSTSEYCARSIGSDDSQE